MCKDAYEKALDLAGLSKDLLVARMRLQWTINVTLWALLVTCIWYSVKGPVPDQLAAFGPFVAIAAFFVHGVYLAPVAWADLCDREYIKWYTEGTTEDLRTAQTNAGWINRPPQRPSKWASLFSYDGLKWWVPQILLTLLLSVLLFLLTTKLGTGAICPAEKNAACRNTIPLHADHMRRLVD